MKVSGFSFIKNAIKYDYPIVEALESILPLCDEVVVAVGDSEDHTLELIQSINPSKIRVIQTIWDPSLKEGGKVLAEETNKALRAVSPDTDWAIYIQGDEAIHEKYHTNILEAMEKYLKDLRVEGLLLKYQHFWGSYSYVGASRKWYAKEIRVIRNLPDIHSWKDAQGFRRNNEKLKVKPVDAYVYHYGYVRHPLIQRQRTTDFARLWHDEEWINKNCPKTPEYDYYEEIAQLKPFTGTHPKPMISRVERINWDFNYDPSRVKVSLKERFLNYLKNSFSISIGEYKNYKII